MTYDPARDSALSYELALLATRERKIRAGKITPRLDDPDEIRWFREGPVPVSQLESDVRNGEDTNDQA